MTRLPHSLLTTFIAVLMAAPLGASERAPAPGYFREPTLRGDTIVFVAEGDLWSVPANGGAAQRLTTGAGQESLPALSPDGRTVAFSARYEGPTEVYTMPVDGGLPTRHTFEAEYSAVCGWHPDGRILYSTSHFSTLPNRQLALLDPATRAIELLPLAEADEGSFDARGESVFFVRPWFHGNATKRYRGGQARKLWRFSPGSAEAEPLTADYAGESHHPMYWDGRVYFLSDRAGNMDIWSITVAGGELRQHTFHGEWDAVSPSLDAGRIAYSVGADLWLLDLTTGKTAIVPIRLPSDFDQMRDRWITDPFDQLSSARLHPRGQSVVLTARGRILVAPVRSGRVVHWSHEPGVRFAEAVFMPDGKEILALSDRTGEMELVTRPADGTGAERALSSDGSVQRFGGSPSPDGKLIALADKNRDLWVLEAASGKQIKVSTRRHGTSAVTWAPDSQWLVFAQTADNDMEQLQLYSIKDHTTTALTSDRVNSFSPAWSPDGKWLYFLSDRTAKSIVRDPWGLRQPEAYFDKAVTIYEMALQDGARSRFRPADELAPPAAKEAVDESEDTSTDSLATNDVTSSKSGKGDDNEADQALIPEARIDREGLAGRVRPLPVPAANMVALRVNADTLFWLDAAPGQDARSHLMALTIGNEEQEAVELAADVVDMDLAAGGEKLLVRQEAALYVIDATAAVPEDLAKSQVDLTTVRYRIDTREDWRQMFLDAWRLERDYFYDPAMHGLDWAKVREKYTPLVDRVTTREELDFVLEEMIGELSALHTWAGGGSLREPETDISPATLGARLERAPEAGGYRIAHIYRWDRDYPEERPPLADPDLHIKEGDVVTAVNGQPVLSVPDIGDLLLDQGGRQVRLGIRAQGTGEERQEIVIPQDDERKLRYADWEQSRRDRVELQGQGKLGYIHLRAMDGEDLDAWYRQYYPVYGRQGLIVDVRHNWGGNIDSLLLEKLLRKAWFYWQERVGQPTWNMQYAFRGHLVVLCDAYTASDGEAFTEGFRRLGLGKVIGTRTWGGEIWLGAENVLSDGGLASAPSMGVYGPEGEWLIEGHGVVPDIEVDNLPHAAFSGQDAQLEAAIHHLLERITVDPRPVPTAPPHPVKGRETLLRSGSAAPAVGAFGREP
ncbi:MAG: PD40 domain-containing protein [Candidatus Schekmanbacteria bacterium]|nr:PD40 domain-containing protein [Candidatus Schekmanbacteria bacterium]